MKILKCLFFLAIPFLIAGLGALIPSAEGYASLKLPDFAPPGWIFPVIWTLLYLCIGLAGYLACEVRDKEKGVGIAMTIYVLQLILNAIWMPLFFVWEMRELAFWDTIVLWILILANIIAFARLNKTATVLLLPYLFWNTFAAILAFSAWQLNI